MKTVIEMAREAGMLVNTSRDSMKHLENFAELVRADERDIQAEAFQQILAATRNAVRADEREACMNALNALPYQRSTKYDCMDAIRAIGKTK